MQVRTTKPIFSSGNVSGESTGQYPKDGESSGTQTWKNTVVMV